MKKRELMIRINDLLDSCSGCENNNESTQDQHEQYCSGCSIYEELKRLRPKLERPIDERREHILAKGPDMTTEDIRKLIELYEVPKIRVLKALKMRRTHYIEMLKNLGLAKEYKTSKKEVVYVKKQGRPKKIDLTIDEYIQMHHIEGKPPKEIAKIKGMKLQQVYNFRTYYREKIEQALEEKGLPKRPVNKRKPKEEKKVTNESKQKDELLLVAKDENSNLELELEEIKKSFQKTMQENRELRNYNAALKAKLEEVSVDDYSLEKIQQENRLLKELIKLYI